MAEGAVPVVAWAEERARGKSAYGTIAKTNLARAARMSVLCSRTGRVCLL
jgi:hypothetical protein